MKISQLLRVSILVLVMPVLSGCWLLAAGGADSVRGGVIPVSGNVL